MQKTLLTNENNYVGHASDSVDGKRERRNANVIFVFCALGALAIPSMLRAAFLPTTLSGINPFFIVACLGSLFYRRNRPLLCSDAVFLGLVILMSLIAVFSNLCAGLSQIYVVKAFLELNLPLILLYNARDFKVSRRCLLTMLKVFNGVMFAIVILAILNLMLSNALTNWILEVSRVSDSNVDRLWSFYGHPLYTTAMLLSFFSLNTVADRRGYRLIPVWLLIGTTTLGVLLCASKSGLIVLVALLFFWYTRKPSHVIVVLSLAALALVFGGYDLVVSRFSLGLTTGRVETWNLLVESNAMKDFQFFYGYGINSMFTMYDNVISWASSAFEFPLLGYALSYGIIYTVILYCLIFLLPTLVFIKRKQWDLLVAFLGVFAFLNGFNAISSVADYFASLIFYETILLVLTQEGTINGAIR